MIKRMIFLTLVIIYGIGYSTFLFAGDWPVVAVSPLDLPVAKRYYAELKTKNRNGQPIMICPVLLSENANLNLGNQTELLAHKESVTSLSFSTNGQFLASGDEKGNIVIWELGANGQWAKSFSLPQKHTTSIIDLDFCLDNTTLLSLDMAGHILRWERKAGSAAGQPWDLKEKIKSGNSKNYCLTYHVSKHGYGTLMLGGREDGFIDLWIVRNGKEFDYRDRIEDNRSAELNNPVISIDVLDYGDTFQIIRGYQNGMIVILDTGSGTLAPKVLTSHNGAVWSIFNYSDKDNHFFATLSSDRTLMIWDAKTLKELKGFCTGYFYYRGLIKGVNLFDIGRTMPLPNLDTVPSSKSEEIATSIQNISAEYKINQTKSGRDSFKQLVAKIRQTYPDYPVSMVQFAPTEKIALMRCLEEALGTYTLLYNYSYVEEQGNSSANVTKNQMILASPFTKFASLAVGNSSSDLTDVRLKDEDYEFVEEYYYENLSSFEENKDYIVIGSYNMNATYGYWMAILLLKKEKDVAISSTSHEFFGYSDFVRPREAREIAKIVAITNIINLIQCRILTKYVDIYNEINGRVEGLLKSSFHYLHPKTVVRGLRILDNDYNEINQYYYFKIQLSDEEYNKLKKEYD